MNNQEDGKDEIVSNKMDGILRPHGNFDWGKIWSIEPWWFWGTQFWDNPRSLLVSSHRTGWMCQAVKSVHQVCSPCEVGICKVFEKKKTCQTHSTNQGDVVPWRIATANSLVPCSPRLQSEEHALDWKLPPAPRAGGSSGVLDASCSHLVDATWRERCSWTHPIIPSHWRVPKLQGIGLQLPRIPATSRSDWRSWEWETLDAEWIWCGSYISILVCLFCHQKFGSSFYFI